MLEPITTKTPALTITPLAIEAHCTPTHPIKSVKVRDRKGVATREAEDLIHQAIETENVHPAPHQLKPQTQRMAYYLLVLFKFMTLSVSGAMGASELLISANTSIGSTGKNCIVQTVGFLLITFLLEMST